MLASINLALNQTNVSSNPNLSLLLLAYYPNYNMTQYNINMTYQQLL